MTLPQPALLVGLILGILVTSAGAREDEVSASSSASASAAIDPVAIDGSQLGLNTASSERPAGRLDVILRRAAEAPEQSRAALEAIGAEWRAAGELSSAHERLLRRARLQIEVEARDLAALAAGLSAAAGFDAADPASAADFALLEAQRAELENRHQPAAQSARTALAFYRAHCPLPSALAVDAVLSEDYDAAAASAELARFAECDYRAVWQAERLLERQALGGGVLVQARASAMLRLAFARAAGDDYRAAQTWSLLAVLAARSEQPAASTQALLRAAREAADRVGDPELRIRMLVNEAAVASQAGDARTALVRTRSALALARAAGLSKLEVMLLNNMADAQLRLRQPRQALRTVESALLVAEAQGDPRILHALRNNAGLARIGIGQIEEGKREMALSEALLGENGNKGQRVQMLREFGDALAAAGDPRGALELFHRERALSAEISRENLEAALREIQASFDAEVRQRDMELLQDQVATRNDELASQDLTLRIWLLLAALLVVMLLLGSLLYGRLRDRERLLSERRERLRRESEQDSLTGLGNRRAFEVRMQSLSERPAAPGAFLLLDIDHFKQINDRFGHASGDIVLVEIARRIQACMRREDLVVRWGGEEFLAHVSGAGSEQALALGRRILERIAAEPIELASGSLKVTASLGLCMDLLPTCRGQLGWEDRLRLADLALYAAKSRGRNRAVAVTDSQGDAEALRAPEIDFEAAERSGLLRTQSAVVGV